MSVHPFRSSLFLAWLSAFVACATDSGGPDPAIDDDQPAANTTVNAIVVEGTAPLVANVEFTITCGDPERAPIDGDFEVADVDPALPESSQETSATWQVMIELPPGPCTIQLRGRDVDQEVICTATEPFTVPSDSNTTVNILLLCSVEFVPPTELPVPEPGNFCPDLLALECADVDPDTAATACQVRFGDLDGTCAKGCDPQTCIVTPGGLVCLPGLDPGVSTTVTCTGALLDCTDDGVPDSSCKFRESGTDFHVTCVPPDPEDSQSPPVICMAVTTDGDLDCDKVKMVTLECSSDE